MSAPMSGDRSFQLIEAVIDRLDGAPLVPRRRWSHDFKARAVAATLVSGANISGIARELGISPAQLFGWRRQAMRKGTVRSSASSTSDAAEVGVRSSPVVEIVVGAVVIRVSADVGEADLRRVIRAVRSA
jgi:transposase